MESRAAWSVAIAKMRRPRRRPAWAARHVSTNCVCWTAV